MHSLTKKTFYQWIGIYISISNIIMIMIIIIIFLHFNYSVPINTVAFIGRVEKVEYKNSKIMGGELFYTELTLNDDTSKIKV